MRMIGILSKLKKYNSSLIHNVYLNLIKKDKNKETQ